MSSTVVFSIGHSTRLAGEFIALLTKFDIRLVADVRTLPRSRRVPWTNVECLPAELAPHGIAYRHFPGLGGLRHARADSPNTGWHNASFRGYADYMQTDDFWTALHDLVEASRLQVTVIMCAEAVPWRCHRSLIADALLVKGDQVKHILGRGTLRTHELTPFAVRVGGRLVYPVQQEDI